MRPNPTQPSFGTEEDAELEWLLCLAAALQAREQQAKKLEAEQGKAPESTLLQGLIF
jgi:hypothetical protein